MDYNFKEIEKKWQKRWAEEKTFKAALADDDLAKVVIDAAAEWGIILVAKK